MTSHAPGDEYERPKTKRASLSTPRRAPRVEVNKAMFRTCQKVHVLQAGGVLLLEAREGCLELQLGDLTCHVPHY